MPVVDSLDDIEVYWAVVSPKRHTPWGDLLTKGNITCISCGSPVEATGQTSGLIAQCTGCGTAKVEWPEKGRPWIKFT